jgi:hypothetical protein
VRPKKQLRRLAAQRCTSLAVLDTDSVSFVTHHTSYGKTPCSREVGESAGLPRGSQPQRRKPTLTSMRTSRTPPDCVAATVSRESTATVTQCPLSIKPPSKRSSRTSLARSTSAPSPAAALPSHSRIVAQVHSMRLIAANQGCLPLEKIVSHEFVLEDVEKA